MDDDDTSSAIIKERVDGGLRRKSEKEREERKDQGEEREGRGGREKEEERERRKEVKDQKGERHRHIQVTIHIDSVTSNDKINHISPTSKEIIHY